MFPRSDGAVVVWEKKCLRRLKKAMAECTVYATARDKVSKVVIDETIKRSALGGLAATAQLPLSALSYGEGWTTRGPSPCSGRKVPGEDSPRPY